MKLKPKCDPALNDKEYVQHLEECLEMRIEMYKALREQLERQEILFNKFRESIPSLSEENKLSAGEK